MKNKGYVLTTDAVIALIFVMGVLIVIISFEFFNPEETGKTAFLNLHYVSEDSLDVLNKKDVLDAVGYNWSLYTNESLESAENLSKEYLDLIIPQNVGYKLEIVENGVVTNISNSDDYNTTRPKMSDATVITHSTRFLVGFGKDKPVLGNVARAAMIIPGINIEEDVWGFIDCENFRDILETGFDKSYCNDSGVESCCTEDNCNIDSSITEDCTAVCFGSSCSIEITAGQIRQGFDGFCCGLGDTCSFTASNNINGDATEHSVAIRCCGPNCITDAGNNVQFGVDIIACGPNSTAGMSTRLHIKGGPNNNVGCMGTDCKTDLRSKTLQDSTIFCWGENCSVYTQDPPDSTTTVFCCGDGCTVDCQGCSYTTYSDESCPITYDFCGVCDRYCRANTLTFDIPYGEPVAEAKGSKNIMIYMDTNVDSISDSNYTIAEWGPYPNDSAGFDPDEDAIDNALMRFLDEINLNDDKSPGNATPLMNNTTALLGGDGSEDNPVDVIITSLRYDPVQAGNIRSLWGPVQFKLIVWM